MEKLRAYHQPWTVTSADNDVISVQVWQSEAVSVSAQSLRYGES